MLSTMLVAHTVQEYLHATMVFCRKTKHGFLHQKNKMKLLQVTLKNLPEIATETLCIIAPRKAASLFPISYVHARCSNVRQGEESNFAHG
jgi:hypothetical protein